MIIFESWTPRWRPQHDLEDTGEVDEPKIGLLPVRGYIGGSTLDCEQWFWDE